MQSKLRRGATTTDQQLGNEQRYRGPKQIRMLEIRMSETRPPEKTTRSSLPISRSDSSDFGLRICFGTRYLPSRLRPLLAALLVIVVIGATHAPCHAGHVHSCWTSFGRWFGVGFGDGYHRCPGPKKQCFHAPHFAQPCCSPRHMAQTIPGPPTSVTTTVRTSSLLPEVRMTRRSKPPAAKPRERQPSANNWHHRDWPQ